MSRRKSKLWSRSKRTSGPRAGHNAASSAAATMEARRKISRRRIQARVEPGPIPNASNHQETARGTGLEGRVCGQPPHRLEGMDCMGNEQTQGQGLVAPLARAAALAEDESRYREAYRMAR